MKKLNTGFTLLELMVVLAVVGLLVGVGIPAMGNFIRNARMTAAANDVMGALHFARSEAVKRRLPVTVCTSTNPLAATPACAASNELRGWIVFVDDNGNGQRDGAEVLLTQHEPLAATISARGSANPLRVTYLATGFAQNTNAGQIVLCDERGNVASGGELSAARGIDIANTGRAGVTRDPAQIATLLAAIGGSVGGCSG